MQRINISVHPLWLATLLIIFAVASGLTSSYLRNRWSENYSVEERQDNAAIVSVLVEMVDVMDDMADNPHETLGCTEDEYVDVNGRCVHIDQIRQEG